MDLMDFLTNHHGFCTLKDILNVVVIPLTVLAITLIWPWWQKWRRRRIFIKLIRKELNEFDPEKKCSDNCKKWSDHLKKKFMHEAILTDLSENRDFILSLDQQLAYDGIQMWMHFHKAEKADEEELVRYHGDRWLDYLERFLRDVNYSGSEDLHADWKKIIEQHKKDI